jgi:hypothetical protein
MSRIRNSRIGDVFLRDFDTGVMKTLDGVIFGTRYYIPTSLLPGVVPPLFTEFTADPSLKGQKMPGIPASMNESSDVLRYLIPGIRITREDPSPALERRHSHVVKYRAPADGAQELTIQYGNREKTGYTAYEEQEEGTPTDLSYTIYVEAGGKGAKTHAHTMLKHCMSKFWPEGKVYVLDTEGRTRGYWVHTEGPSGLSSVSDIRDRTIIYALSLRVQGELDVRMAKTQKTVTSPPNTNVRQMSQLPEE